MAPQFDLPLAPPSSMETSVQNTPTVRSADAQDGVFQFVIEGRLDSFTTGKIWRQAIDTLAKGGNKRALLDASRIDYCDGAGIALLVHLREQQRKAGGELEIRDLRPELRKLVDEENPEELSAAQPKDEDKGNFFEQVGRTVYMLWLDTRALVGFVGELFSALVQAAREPHRVRWQDTLKISEAVGIDALPIVVLVGFLMGLIMAFQAAVPLGQFGAQIFVANLIGLAILRELGPLMTAIVLAGRSASAFAAELGTMKVREEIDALKTMGLEPVRFLVVPRVIAAVVMTPLLTIFADLVGVMGGSVVLLSLGYPLITFFHQMQSAVTYGSPIGGLVKAFVFGILVAAVGCQRGLQTTTGPTAVGESTTSAVVSGIILIVITDGIFSVIYYYLWI